MPTQKSPKTAHKQHLYRLEQELGVRFGWTSTPALRDEVILCVKRKAARLVLEEITYYNMLLKSPAELLTLAEEVANGETAFFREPCQFSFLNDKVIPDLIKANRQSRQLRLWSMACSTGEEPYSLSLLLRERLRRIDEWKVELLATDFRSGALLDANQGRYPLVALRNLSEEQRERHFNRLEETGFCQIQPEAKRLVSFRRANLSEPAFWRQIKKGYDLIVCNNLLIYLHPVAARQIIKRLGETVRPGGFLMVAVTEKSLIEEPAFVPLDVPGLFRRKEG